MINYTKFEKEEGQIQNVFFTLRKGGHLGFPEDAFFFEYQYSGEAEIRIHIKRDNGDFQSQQLVECIKTDSGKTAVIPLLNVNPNASQEILEGLSWAVLPSHQKTNSNSNTKGICMNNYTKVEKEKGQIQNVFFTFRKGGHLGFPEDAFFFEYQYSGEAEIRINIVRDNGDYQSQELVECIKTDSGKTAVIPLLNVNPNESQEILEGLSWAVLPSHQE